MAVALMDNAYAMKDIEPRTVASSLALTTAKTMDVVLMGIVSVTKVMLGMIVASRPVQRTVWGVGSVWMASVNALLVSLGKTVGS